MGYKVKRIYQGTNLVRPSEITETYTIPSVSAGSSKVYQYKGIAKSGYKISKIVIETTGASNDTSNYGNLNCGIKPDPSSGNLFQWTLGIGQNNYHKFEYANNGTFVDAKTGLSGGNRTSSNTIIFTITRDSCVALINGSNNTYTYTTTVKNIVEGILNSSTVQTYSSATRGNMGVSTVTVTYTPN